MHDIPECLNRRYHALDDLVRDLTSAMNDDSPSRHTTCENNTGIKLMCDFWKILQENPDCNLPEEVQYRMGIEGGNSNSFANQQVDCYMANKELDKSCADRRKDAMNRIRTVCCPRENEPSSKKFTCNSKSISQTPSAASENVPLSKVLCNLKEAVSFDKKCNVRVAELMAAQKELTEQIQNLEQREKAGAQLMKQADCMWSCMEDTYKQKVAESLERQKILLTQLKEVENSAKKWRKNKKDLEFQISSIEKCHEDIKEKINQKTNDFKVMDMEIKDLKKRIESNTKDTDVSRKSLRGKKEASDAKIATINAEIAKLQKKITAEQKIKVDKEKEGSKYVKDAREDLQKICRVLLQKKLENEDLKAEKEALLQEINILSTAADTCKEKCKQKDINLNDEIKKIDEEIAAQKVKSLKCHECTDTSDARKYCTDCPRCLKERNCVIEGDHCTFDSTVDCVCMSVKQKFLDNVFDNMYTILERQAMTNPGKAVAESVMNCLKRSKNGKLNGETRQILQEFILSTVKKNLNLTIVGGAVKTRCEMDPETYKQLMLCLKDVQVTKPAKEDKGIGAKKEPCSRWAGTSECQCPKGPKACICTQKAPPPAHDPTTCGPPDPEDMPEVKMCPHKDNTACGPDCGMQGGPLAKAGIDVAAWRPDPCQGQNCHFAKNMRAAQCVLGSEALANTPKSYPTPPIIPTMPMPEDDMGECKCGEKSLKPCPCHGDRRSQPRQRIIEEVMGRYTEVPPIEKVISVADPSFAESNELRRNSEGCNCSNLPLKYLLASNITDNKISQFCACSTNYVAREALMPYIDKMLKKSNLNICQSGKNYISAYENGALRSKHGRGMSQHNKSDNDIKVLLCPKYPQSYDDTIKLSLGICNILSSESTHMRLKRNSSSEVGRELFSYDVSFVERKICDTVKNLIKDIVVPEVPTLNNLTTSDVEWVPLESLFKEIISLTKLEESSSDTANEIEVKCETLEASKEFRLIQEKVYDMKSVHMSSNLIGTQKNICNQKEVSNELIEIPTTTTIYKSKKRFTSIAEELKSKLLEDIRGTYDMADIELSVESMRSMGPVLDSKNFKNIRRCLKNVGVISLDTNEYDSKYLQLQKKGKIYDCNNTNRKFKNWRLENSGVTDVTNVTKYLAALSDAEKEQFQTSELEVKKLNKNKCGFIKTKKITKYNKRSKGSR